MKHLSTYIKEERIDEFFGLGSLVKFFKIVFMPWSDEAKRWYHKFFMESYDEILEAKDHTSFPKVLDQKYGNITVEVYDINSSKSSYKKLGKTVLKNAQATGEDPLIHKCNTTSKNYKYFYKIYIDDPQKGIIGVVAPDRNKQLNCISSVSDPKVDKNEYSKIFKNKKTIVRIFNDIGNCVK